MLCLFRKARKADATALWEKREGLSLGRAASASFREAGRWFSLRLLGRRATTQGKREGRELFGTAALGERTALWAKREATGARSDVVNATTFREVEPPPETASAAAIALGSSGPATWSRLGAMAVYVQRRQVHRRPLRGGRRVAEARALRCPRRGAERSESKGTLAPKYHPTPYAGCPNARTATPSWCAGNVRSLEKHEGPGGC